MDHFDYRSGELYAEDVSLREIAGRIGTPFYCYSTATITRHYRLFAGLFGSMKTRICYAVKANSNIAILSVLAKEGAGADVVSEGEIRRAVFAGIAPERIVFSGVGKTANEMKFALESGIFQFNVESEAELYLLSKVAKEMNVNANYAVRVNPDVEPSTHGKINTGRKESKFGISITRAPSLIRESAKLPAVNFKGISVHIGSQITDFKSFALAFSKVASLAKDLEKDGIRVHTLDLGGGIGISYANQEHPSLEGYGVVVRDVFKDFACEFIFEPGRVIVGNGGVLVSKVIYIKDDGERKFLILDAGMNDLIRPSLYSAFHEIVPIKKPARDDKLVMDIVGPVCETGDIFAEQREIQKLASGDLVAFRSAGAYGAVMSSIYNSRLLVPEVLVSGSRWEVVRPRPTYDDMLAGEKIPAWI